MILHNDQDAFRVLLETYKARNFQRKYGIEFTTLEGRYIIMPLKKTEKFFHIKIGKKNLLDSLKFWE